jgi:hypothetical protein
LYVYPSEKVLQDVKRFTLPDTFYTKKWVINYGELTENLRLPFFFILK